MGKGTYDEGLEGSPGLGLGGVGEKVHDDRSLGDGLFNGEEGLSRYLEKRWERKRQ